jgi:septal ring factor EnvC (AmiA/AmiB activator)
MSKVIFPILLLVTLVLPCLAQKRDPLTENESDQVRELAQEPDKRIKLMVKFIGARMTTIEQMEGDPRMAGGRGKQVHDLLEDFTALIDELDDNIDDYVDKKADIRKSLKDVIEANTNFQLKLRTLKEQKASSKEFADYTFVLQNATEAVNGCLDNARQALQDLEAALKEEKKKK